MEQLICESGSNLYGSNSPGFIGQTIEKGSVMVALFFDRHVLFQVAFDTKLMSNHTMLYVLPGSILGGIERKNFEAIVCRPPTRNELKGYSKVKTV